MPERQSRHPDNEMIDAITEDATPGQSGRAGGELARDVGTRAEKHHVKDADPRVERVRGADKSEAQDAAMSNNAMRSSRPEKADPQGPRG